MATVAELRRRARGRRPTRQRLPDAIERRHAQVVARLVRELNALIQRLLADVADAFVDEPRADGGRMDARSPNPIIKRILKTWERTVRSPRTQRRFRQAAQAADTFNKKQVARSIKSVIGIDIAVAEPFVAQAVGGFVKTNVNLVTRMGRQELGKIEKLVRDAQDRGTRVETLAAQIERRLKVTESRAQLIARDQMNKLNSRLTRERHQGLGIRQYIWRTSQDDRVREEHEVREGKTYSYDRPPSDGNPGEPVQCRCIAEPVINDAVLKRAAA